MHDLSKYYSLVDMIDKELGVIARKGEFDSTNGDKDLERLYKLTSSLDKICKKIAHEKEEEYEEEHSYDNRRMRWGVSNRRYPRISWDSSHAGVMKELEEALDKAHDEETRMTIQDCINRVSETSNRYRR